MSSGERPIGAAKGKQSDTEALCQTPPKYQSRAAIKQGTGGGGAQVKKHIKHVVVCICSIVRQLEASAHDWYPSQKMQSAWCGQL